MPAGAKETNEQELNEEIPEEKPASSQKKRQKEQKGQPKKRRRTNGPPLSGKATQHGSYKGYYNRRLRGRSVAKDERFPLVEAIIKKLDVEKPALLDIGCNNGAFTTFVASKTKLQRAVGVDIDAELIANATSALSKYAAPYKAAARKQTLEEMSNTDFTPISCLVVQGPIPEKTTDETVEGGGEDKTEHKEVGEENSEKEQSGEFPFNTSFRCEDFSSEKPGCTAKEAEAYDIILCLSVTKWVHMYGGDEALTRLFKRMYNCLRTGGVMILEPQQKQSYKRARQKKIDGANKTFRDLKIQPAQFKDYLLGPTVGFARCEVLRDVKAEKGTDFNRPVFAFYKEKSPGMPIASNDSGGASGNLESGEHSKSNVSREVENRTENQEIAVTEKPEHVNSKVMKDTENEEVTEAQENTDSARVAETNN